MRTRLTGRIILSMTAVALFTMVLVSASFSRADSAPPQPLAGAFVPDSILIGIKPEKIAELNLKNGPGVSKSGIRSVDVLNARYNVQQIEPVFGGIKAADPLAAKYGLPGILKMTVPLGTDIFAMIADYQADAAVAYAEPNRIYVALGFPSDPNFGNQWALHNTGQTGGLADADIDAPEAWDVTQGSSVVLIAVVDTGVDYTHPDLDGGRVRTDIDRDFADSDEDAMDNHGHGTFVSAIIGADANDGQGVAGICWNCQILPIKVLNSNGSGTAEWVAQGIQYAADAGASIISMSLGFPANCGCSQTVGNAINYAFERGSLLIAASGNDADKERISYPAASPRVLAVGSSNHTDQESEFSNRGSDLDIVAPGEDIYSAMLNGSYETASGTSAATPHVSGVAGLLLSANPGLRNVELWWRLVQTADDFTAAGEMVNCQLSIVNCELGHVGAGQPREQFGHEESSSLAAASPAKNQPREQFGHEESSSLAAASPAKNQPREQFGHEESSSLAAASPALSSLDYQLFLPAIADIKTRTTLGRLNAYSALTIPIIGEVIAPVDTCAGEPVGCVPGCGAEVVLVNRTSVFEDLQLLRDYRDTVLHGTAVGEKLTSLYEGNRLEMALLFATDPTLRTNTRQLLEHWFPLIRALVDPETAASAILTEALIRETESVADQISNAGGESLRADIAEFKALIAAGHLYAGMDARNAWPLWAVASGEW